MKPENQAQTGIYLRLLKYLTPYWKKFTLAVIAMIATASTEPVFPAIMKRLLDDGFKTQNTQLIWAIPVGIVSLFVVRSIFVFTTGYLMMWVTTHVVKDLRQAMFEKLLIMPVSYSLHHSPGQIISKIVYDIGNISEAVTTALVSVIRESLTTIALLGYLFYLDWKLTLITLCTGPLIAFFVRSFGKRMRHASQQSMSAMQKLSQVIEETAAAQKLVKVYGGQNRQLQAFELQNDSFRKAQMRETIPASATTPVTHIAVSVAIAIITYIAMSQATGNAGQSPGGFVAFITAMLLLIAPLKQLTTVKTYLHRGLAAAENVFNFLDQKSEIDDGKIEPKKITGELRLVDVTFAYPGTNKPALENISLTLPAGTTTALVGTSGGGKTTLANLIPRYYSASSGCIFLDDVPINDYTLQGLRNEIAHVSQDVFLFNDTIYANIAFGSSKEVSRDQVIEAAKNANAWDFIQQLPAGLDTSIGTNGALLSGGQRQRIAIARALLKDAPILILDEATSALDNESERKVQDALERLMQNRTTLVIAHRLSTIENANNIIVIVGGRIAEMGTHQQLTAMGKIYCDLSTTQGTSSNILVSAKG